jgi:hypothetical protein
MCLTEMKVTLDCRSRSVGGPRRLCVRKERCQAMLTGYLRCWEGRIGLLTPFEAISRAADISVTTAPSRQNNILIPIDHQQPLTRASNPAVSSLEFSPTPVH